MHNCAQNNLFDQLQEHKIQYRSVNSQLLKGGKCYKMMLNITMSTLSVMRWIQKDIGNNRRKWGLSFTKVPHVRDISHQ